jgi:hypothetical protein
VAFKVGQYARTSDGIVFIQGFSGDSLQAVRIDREDEGEYFASHLAPWKPQDGERVTEAGNEASPIGFVVYAGDGTSEIVWGGLFMRQQTWLNKNLEPVWD